MKNAAWIKGNYSKQHRNHDFVAIDYVYIITHKDFIWVSVSRKFEITNSAIKFECTQRSCGSITIEIRA